MQKFYQDEEVNFEVTFYSDRAKTTPVDPGTVTLELTDPGDNVVTTIVAENGSRPANIGKYTSSNVMDSYGIWQWKWITENPRIVRQGTLQVIQTNQDD